MKPYSIICLIVASFLIACNSATEPSSPIQSAAVVDTVNTKVPTPGILVVPEVEILGKQGFVPSELSLKTGDQVIWTNRDPAGKAAVLTIQQDGTRKFVNSDILQIGKNWSHTFEGAGAYHYWTQGYGIKGVVTVE